MGLVLGELRCHGAGRGRSPGAPGVTQSSAVVLVSSAFFFFEVISAPRLQ